MRRHRTYTYTRTQASTAPLTRVQNFGTASAVVDPTFKPETVELFETRSMIDEVKTQYREHSCDHVVRVCEPYGTPVTYASSSTPSTVPWVNYSVWTGHIGLWRRWWDTLTPAGDTTIGNAAFGAMHDPVKGLAPLYDVSDEGTLVIRAPADIQSLIARSLRSMLPGISSEISAANSVFELKDVISLRKLVAAASGLGRRVQQFVVRGRLKPKATLQSIIRYASQQHLVQSFAVDPLVSDIAAIYKVMATVDEKISKILTEEGKLLHRHYTCPLLNLASTYEESMTGSLSNGTKFRLTRDVRYLNPRFRATVSYSYRLTQFEREHARLLGLLDALGVNWTPQIIWNAIPFSFILDWFVKVDRWLENLQLSNLEPIVELNSYVWSVTMVRETKLGLSPNRIDQPLMTPDPMYTHVLTENLYKRVSETRVSMYRPLEVSGLSLKELSLALALKFG